jgi:hypothetical protein
MFNSDRLFTVLVVSLSAGSFALVTVVLFL